MEAIHQPSKNSPVPSPVIPAWQTERAKFLQRACESIQAAVKRGVKLHRALRRISRRYHRRYYKCDRARKISLAPGTLRQLWLLWKKNGELPSAFKLNYYAVSPRIPRSIMLRFVEFCATRRLPSLSAAWQTFAGFRINARPAAGISYYQVSYSFSAAAFNAMQRELRLIAQATARRDKIKFKAIADVTARLPLRVPKRGYVRRGNDFQI